MLFLMFLRLLLIITAVTGTATKTSKQVFNKYLTNRDSSANLNKREGIGLIFLPTDRVLKNKKKDKDNINTRIHQHRVIKRSLNTTEPSNTIRPKITITPPPFLTIPPPSLVCTGDKSCQGRCANYTEWRTQSKFGCYCDPDCYEVFYDCCADYVKYCGVQKPKYVPTKKYNWTCESIGYYDSNFCEIGEGLWMVAQCPNDWLNDEIRTKCERPTNKVTLDSGDLSRYIPVVDISNVTFRNFYCAMCNNAASPVDFWPVYIQTSVIPPRNYNISQKIEFLLLNDAKFPRSNGPSYPKITQARRYCIKNIIKSCSKGKTDDSCSNGSTALVSSLATYKNLHCALCQSSGALIPLTCFPGLILASCSASIPQPFLLKLDYRNTFNNKEEICSFAVEREPCGMRGTLYDHILQVCLHAIPELTNTSGYDRFLVYSWLRPDIRSKSISFSQKDFRTTLEQSLDTSATLISNVSISAIARQRPHGQYPAFILVSSTITLTPRQSLLLSQYENSKNYDLMNFIFFNRPFNLIVNNTNYTVIKTTSRQTEMSALPLCKAEKSCLGRCTQNRTEWRNDLKFVCYCDPDCYEVFNDCCSDYEKYCDTQTPKFVATQTYNWTCEAIGHFSLRHCSVGDGIWMVSKCDLTWPYDQIRTKCEAPLRRLSLSSLDFERHCPVVSHKNVSFRNAYCALCNGVEQYEPWVLDIQASVVPPENYNTTEKMRFLLRHGATFPDSSWRPKPNQPRRYCLRGILTSCPGNKSSHPCSNGPTSVVSVPGLANYKNIHCAICHTVPISFLSCFPDGLRTYCASFIPQLFSLVFSKREEMSGKGTSVISVTKTHCSKKGLIYDYQLRTCRVNRTLPLKQSGHDSFYAVAWLQPQGTFRKSKTSINIDFHKMLMDHFNVLDFQVVISNTTTIDEIGLHVIECTIIFTTEQSLHALSGQNNKNGDSLDKNLFEFLYFKRPFTLKLDNNSFTVVKTISRPLTCLRLKEYTRDQYSLLDDDIVYVNSTNTTYKKFEYFTENSQLHARVDTMNNIAVCEKYQPAGCASTQTILSVRNFTIFTNLSIYHSKTSVMYHYGEYVVFTNNSIAVCDTAVPNIAEEAVETIKDNEVFNWITVAGFVLSFTFLAAIVLFYKKFQLLRTPPSKNLLHFAASLLIFQVLWVVTGFKTVRDNPSLCTRIAIIEHYSLLASFTSMSVMALDTCKFLAKNPQAPRSSRHKRKLLCVYASTIWLVPAALVAICLLLDTHDIVYVGYDDTDICWLTDKNAHIYFVAIPIGILLLFNVIAFGKSVRHLSGSRQSNFSIYMVLSILMGFSWLFALLAIVAEHSKIFWYLFVIFISTPGVFVASAFLLKVKNVKLDSNLSSVSIRNHYQSQSTMRVRNIEVPRSQTTAM